MCIICEKKYKVDITTLDCSNCKQITTIPHLPKLLQLDCHNCINLSYISNIPSLTNINCHGCANLKILNYYPNLKYLNTANCPLLKIGRLSIELIVHITEITSLPVSKAEDNLISKTIQKEDSKVIRKEEDSKVIKKEDIKAIKKEDSKVIKKEDENIEEPVYNGKRGKEFKQLLENILVNAKIKSKYMEMILSDENMILYDHAFTSKTVNPINNFEIYEQLGDVTANKFITWYMYKRFPKLNCTEGVKIVARLKINYAAKKSFYEIASSLKFWEFISSTEAERQTRKKPLLEDCFESFIGVTEKILDEAFGIGVGYSILYRVLQSIFDKIYISLKYEDLYDPITRLKELFDANKKELLKLTYKFKKNEEDKMTEYNIFCEINGVYTFTGQGVSTNKPFAKQKASQMTLSFLNKKGYIKKCDEFYNQICQAYKMY